MTVLDILFVKLSEFSSGISDFFSLSYTQSFCRLVGASRVKSFSSCQTVFFYQTDITFKPFSKGSSAGFSSVSNPFTHLWCFQAFESFNVYFFHHSLYWWLTDSYLFINFSWCQISMGPLFLWTNQLSYQIHVFFQENIPRSPWAMPFIYWTNLSEFFQ